MEPLSKQHSAVNTSHVDVFCKDPSLSDFSDDDDENSGSNYNKLYASSRCDDDTSDLSITTGSPAPSLVDALPPSSPSTLQKYKICPTDHHWNPPCDWQTMSNRELALSKNLFRQEYAELSFNHRVLHLALDKSLPLLERFKFLCIVSSNLDEQFAKRLGNIPKYQGDDFDELDAAKKWKKTVRPPSTFEEGYSNAVRDIVKTQYDCLKNDLLPELKKHGIEFVKYRKLTPDQKSKLRSYFTKKIYPLITPLSVDQSHPFPLLQSHGVYLLVILLNPETSKTRRVYFRIPNVEPRCIPVSDDNLKYVVLEDVVLENLDTVCEGMELLKAFSFRVTRNVKLVVDDTLFGESDNLLDFIWEETHRRRSAPATRLEVEDKMPQEFIDILKLELFLDDSDIYRIPGNMLGLSEFFSVSLSPCPRLQFPPLVQKPPGPFKGIEEKLQSEPGKIFSVIRKSDVLVQYPIHSFTASALLFLRAAARDPKVRVIKCVIYRGGSNSPLVTALIRAAKAGKEVSVLVELKASFDEVQNSEYARMLQKAGVNVSYGLVGLKTHSKTMLVVREEDAGFRPYINIATGNFNPRTAKLYTDMALFTCRENLCADVIDLFNALTGYSRKRNYRSLLVAPVNMLHIFVNLIRQETENALAGNQARIVVQINGLTEPIIAEHLYAASQAGVQIELIVRGICNVRPGLAGKSDNIRVFSWVGQVLQHRRIFYFSANGANKYFIGSADWRSRNLNDRVEVVVPVEDKKLQKKLKKCLMFFLNDTTSQTWEMASDGRYYLRKHIDKRLDFPDPREVEQRVAIKAKKSSSITQTLPLWVNGKWQVSVNDESVLVDAVYAAAIPIRRSIPNSELEVLLLSPNVSSSAYRTIPKGTLIEDDTLQNTAIRALADSTGVSGDKLVPYGWYVMNDKNSTKGIFVFSVETRSESNNYAEEYMWKKQWFNISDALKENLEHDFLSTVFKEIKDDDKNSSS